MSVVPSAMRNMRIVAIPLTRPLRRVPASAQAQGSLTYYQFQITRSPPQQSKPKTSTSRWLPEGGLVNWISTKATDTWSSFGKSEGGWKLKVFQMGERLADRMEFEELALKSIDPSLGPKFSPSGTINSEQEKYQGSTPKIAFIYPPSIKSGPESLNEFCHFVATRISNHRRGFYLWMFIAPITTPFMLVPIIPNLPFFFCVWRSWSHYKAYRASQYLETLLDAGYIVPAASESLDVIYKDFATNPNSNSSATPDMENPPNHTVILTKDAVSPIVNLFGLPSTSSADLLRAVQQANERVNMPPR